MRLGSAPLTCTHTTDHPTIHTPVPHKEITMPLHNNHASLINNTAPHIHDPAIVQDHDGSYAVFGTHRMFAHSDDLVHWSPLTNNLTRNPEAELGAIWEQWPASPTNPDLRGNTWAPDVIWNPTMHRWCMYLSLNGDDLRSVIVLLVAEELTGNWTYVGPVIYSGFTGQDIARTDANDVLREAAATSSPMDAARILDVARYMSRKDTRINAIDAAPVLCEDGTMWLAFGSWFAGIWMLRLDPTTGLRDRSIRYPLIRDTTGNASVSDPYYGVKIAGGYWNSGEGAYLVQRDGWWFLMLSYGWLGRTGGYQVREFRARSPLGPFVDMHGNPAIALGETPHNETGRTGVRMLSSVHWHDGSDAIEVSQGHNSVLQRNDGRMFLVYHTRFADRFHPDDDEDFDMRVRELVMTDNGWLAVSPALYRGEPMQPVDMADIPGDYDIIIHDPTTCFTGDTDDTGRREGVGIPQAITLQADGRIICGEAVAFSDTNGLTAPRMTDGAPTCGLWHFAARARPGLPEDDAGPVIGSAHAASDIVMHLNGMPYHMRAGAQPHDAAPARILLTGVGCNQAVWGVRRG
ncbi:beta-xylosidase [Bifidobacterium pseudolongum subsp. globosum]|uniref:Beta-xylosidase n=2 Tax=Bifidobacterium pseudolongum TaxID=1694 RepID=A0A4Q5BIU5_9BIFI|nr:beta-xylosidase [Bifidobacterium pseudolongum subsp. globosum]